MMEMVRLLLIFISLGLILGTFLKFSMYGINNKLSLFLTIITPLLLFRIAFKQINYHLKNDPKKIFRSIIFSIIDYPMLVTTISEITLEMTALTIARRNALYNQDLKVHHKRKPKKPVFTADNLDTSLSFEIVKKTFNLLNQASRMNFKAS